MAKKTMRKQTAAAKTARATAAKTRKTSAKARKTAAKKRTTPARRSAVKKAVKKTARKKTAARAAAKRSAAKRRTPPPAKQKPSTLGAAATAVRGRVASAIATIGQKLPWGSSDPDAIQMLERDHRRFEDLMKQGEETTERARATRRELLNTLTAELNAHELLEEKILYPALQSHPEARDIVLEGYEEHHVADLIVAELHQVATNDEQWGAKFKVLKESIEHHIKEEEGQMFKTARGIFSREELLDLAERMLALRRSTA